MNVWDQLHKKLNSYWDILVLSIPKIALSVIILAVFVLIATFLGRYFRKVMNKKATDSITANFVIRLSKFAIIVCGIMLAFHALGLTGIAGGLLAGAGASAVIIGFAFKEIGENFLAGIILIFDRPFNVGDTVTIEDKMGVVNGLKFRTTHLKAFDGQDIYVPNSSVIRNPVTNHTRDGLLRHDFKLQVDRKANLRRAIKTIKDTVDRHPKVLKHEQTQVLVAEIGKDAVTVNVLFWIETKDYKYGSSQVKSQVLQNVGDALQAMSDKAAPGKKENGNGKVSSNGKAGDNEEKEKKES
jgi:small-conductance mechanosensitive channel